MTRSGPVRVGLIGAGWMGRFHGQTLARRIPEAELVAVADPAPGAARQAADELGSVGIRANAVRPSLVPTDISAGLVGSPDIVADYLDQMPLARLGTVDDIALAVRFLLGPESSWITGQCISADGGHHLRRGPNLTPLMEMVFGADTHPH